MELCTNHCIVTFMDLIDVKEMIQTNSPSAVQKMQQFHQKVYNQITNNMPNHQHAYTWNDSVLLIAEINENIHHIMKEADDLKKEVDSICHCYAISVKGMSFSEPQYHSGHQFNGENIGQPKFVYLKASSYAFSNCYNIENKLGKKHKKDWYVDKRIIDKIQISHKAEEIELFEMLPSCKKRNIYMYNGYLW